MATFADGQSDRKEQASCSHPHNAVFDPSGHFIAVPDKGLDRVFVFRLYAENGEAGGERSALRGQSRRFRSAAHCLSSEDAVGLRDNELGSSVTTYRFDSQHGSLQPIQIVPSIPPSHTGDDRGAEIALAPSGGVVYSSTRGCDSIANFAVDPRSGKLTPAGWAPTHAKSHRFFCLDPAEQILYAANADEDYSQEQNTDTIVPYRINQANGMLTPTGQVHSLSAAVCSRRPASAANTMNSAISSAADPATTNTFQHPAVAAASFVTLASRLASCKSHGDQEHSDRPLHCKSARDVTETNGTSLGAFAIFWPFASGHLKKASASRVRAASQTPARTATSAWKRKNRQHQ